MPRIEDTMLQRKVACQKIWPTRLHFHMRIIYVNARLFMLYKNMLFNLGAYMVIERLRENCPNTITLFVVLFLYQHLNSLSFYHDFFCDWKILFEYQNFRYVSEYLDFIWIVLFKCQECLVASVEPLSDGFLVKILKVSPIVVFSLRLPRLFLFLSSITTPMLKGLLDYLMVWLPLSRNTSLLVSLLLRLLAQEFVLV